MRIDVVTIFPDYLAPLELSPARQGARPRPARRARARPARLDPRPPPHRRRHALRRRRRHGHEARAVGRGARRRRRGRRAPTRRRPDPGGRAVHPGARARAGAGEQRSSSPAAATRASTSGSSTTPPHRDRSRGLAGRLRPQRRRGRRAGDDRGGRPAAAGLHGQRRSRSSRSRTPTGCWSTPSTPSRPPGAGRDVPEVLLSGDHGADRRLASRAVRSRAHRRPRPDLLHPGPGRRLRRGAAPGRPRRRRGAPTLQRACWVQEALATPDVGSPPCTRPSTTCAGLEEWTRVVRAAAGAWSGPCAAGSSTTWHVGRLMVAPDLQGQGLGRALLERVRPRPLRARAASLFTGAGASVALRMYSRPAIGRAGLALPPRDRTSAEGPNDYGVNAPCGKLMPWSVLDRGLPDERTGVCVTHLPQRVWPHRHPALAIPANHSTAIDLWRPRGAQ